MINAVPPRRRRNNHICNELASTMPSTITTTGKHTTLTDAYYDGKVEITPISYDRRSATVYDGNLAVNS